MYAAPSCGPLTCPATGSELYLEVQKGETWRFVVDGPEGASGAGFRLDVLGSAFE